MIHKRILQLWHILSTRLLSHHHFSSSDITLIENLYEWKMVYTECYHQIGFDISSFFFILFHSFRLFLPNSHSISCYNLFLSCTLFHVDGNFCSSPNEKHKTKKISRRLKLFDWSIHKQKTVLETDYGLCDLVYNKERRKFGKWKISFFSGDIQFISSDSWNLCCFLLWWMKNLLWFSHEQISFWRTFSF